MIHDDYMPRGWHTVKLVLLAEMNTANTFYKCQKVADAIFHARLVGENIAKDHGLKLENGSINGSTSENCTGDAK